MFLLVITVFSFCFRITQSSAALMVSIFSCTLSPCLMRCWTSSGLLLGRLFSCSRARPSCLQSTQVVIYTQKIKTELLIKDKDSSVKTSLLVVLPLSCIVYYFMYYKGHVFFRFDNSVKKNGKPSPTICFLSNFQMGRSCTSNHPKWQYVKML